MVPIKDSVPGAAGRVGEPASKGRSAAQEQFGGDRHRDHHDQNDCGDPDAHGQ